MIRCKFAFLLALILTTGGSRLWAWGCSGHETVALIALQSIQKLDSQNHTHVAQQVETLLSVPSHGYSGRFCNDLGLDKVAYYATWADDHRAVDPKTGSWHFWDIPLSVPAAKLGEYCADGCVIQALQTQIGILRDNTQDSVARSTALMYVIHFVGDLHQPLHAEDNNDRGGNCVPVTFLQKSPKPASGAGNYSPNLHAVWDTDIVENIGQISRHNADAKNQLEAFASRLETEHASEIDQALRGSVDFVAWANEAHQIARADPYAQLKPAIAPAGRIAPVASCTDGDTSSTFLNQHEAISQAYITSVQGDVLGQLSKAGGRLAAVLYTALK